MAANGGCVSPFRRVASAGAVRCTAFYRVSPRITGFFNRLDQVLPRLTGFFFLGLSLFHCVLLGSGGFYCLLTSILSRFDLV